MEAARLRSEVLAQCPGDAEATARLRRLAPAHAAIGGSEPIGPP